MHRNRNALSSELLHGWISRIVLKHYVWVTTVKESHWRWNLRVGSPWTTMFFLSCRIVFPADTCTVTVLMPSLENVHGRLPSRVITGCWGRERQGVSRSKAPDILTLLILTPQHAHVRLTKEASCSVYTVRTYRVPWGKDSLILTMNLLQFLVPYQEKRNPEPVRWPNHSILSIYYLTKNACLLILRSRYNRNSTLNYSVQTSSESIWELN